MTPSSHRPLKTYLRTLLNDLLDELADGTERLPSAPLPWGYPTLDDPTDRYGYRASLSIVGAAPGDGTTAFLLTPLLHAALQLAIPARVFLLQESADAIARRIVSRLAKVPLWRLERGTLRASDWNHIPAVFKALTRAQIEFVDVTGRSLLDLCDEVVGPWTVAPQDAVIVIDSLDRLADWAAVERRPNALRSLTDASGVPVIAALRGLASPSPTVAASCERLLRLHPIADPYGDRRRLEIQRSTEAPARRYVDLGWLHATAELVEVGPSAPANQLALRI